MGYVTIALSPNLTLNLDNSTRSIAKGFVAERLGPDKKTRRDMLGSFIRHGLTQKEAQSEALLQM